MSHIGFIGGAGGGIPLLGRAPNTSIFSQPPSSIFGDIIDLIPGVIDIFRPRDPGAFLPGGGQRPTLPMPGNGRPPTFGTCRNQTGTKMPPSVADNGSLCCPPGFHLSRTKDPCTGNSASCCVRNRRMNALNPRALSRATRRLTSFNKTIARTQKALRRLAPPRRRPAKQSDASVMREIRAAGIGPTGKQMKPACK